MTIIAVKSKQSPLDHLSSVMREKRSRRPRLTFQPVGSDRISYWLGLAAREARDEAGLIRSPIAGRANVDTSVIANFEMGRSSPRELDAVLDAYAEECGLEDYRVVWERALKLCRERSETDEFERHFREAAAAGDLNGSPGPTAPKPRAKKTR